MTPGNCCYCGIAGQAAHAQLFQKANMYSMLRTVRESASDISWHAEGCMQGRLDQRTVGTNGHQVQMVVVLCCDHCLQQSYHEEE